MRVLAIDSSACTASVAIAEENKILCEFYSNTRLTHSQTLMSMVKDALNCTGIELSTIDLFASSTGPGSFTGIRIGVSAIKGMAQAMKKPCLGVSTLEAIAVNIVLKNCIVCSVMDARCSQVYNATFKCENNTLTRLTEDKALSILELEEYLQTIDDSLPIVLAGDGAELCYSNFMRNNNILIAPDIIRFQRATGVGIIALNHLHTNEITTASNLTPKYLRLPQAERELRIKNGEVFK